MTPTISPELQDKIEQEAIAKYPGIDNNIKGPANCHKYRKAFITGAIAYAHYKERFEQAKKALEEISHSDRPGTYEEMAITLDLIYSTISALLASWKEEGKEPEFEVITELWVVYNGRVPELEGFTREVKYKVVIDMGRVLRLLNDEGKEVLEDARYFTRIE